jgi:hypothetical protein
MCKSHNAGFIISVSVISVSGDRGLLVLSSLGALQRVKEAFQVPFGGENHGQTLREPSFIRYVCSVGKYV